MGRNHGKSFFPYLLMSRPVIWSIQPRIIMLGIWCACFTNEKFICSWLFYFGNWQNCQERWLQSKLFSLSLLLKVFKKRFYVSERYRESRSRRSCRQRAKKALCWERKPMWDSIPGRGGHELSQQQPLTRLSPPGVHLFGILNLYSFAIFSGEK